MTKRKSIVVILLASSIALAVPLVAQAGPAWAVAWFRRRLNARRAGWMARAAAV